jgi:predicted O-methyltransferase YrrM
MSIVDEIKQFWWHDGHLNEDQRDFLVSLLTELRPSFCIETGFATGRSAVTILIAAQPKKLISIDANLDYMGARSHANHLMNQFNCLQVIGERFEYFNDR